MLLLVRKEVTVDDNIMTFLYYKILFVHINDKAGHTSQILAQYTHILVIFEKHILPIYCQSFVSYGQAQFWVKITHIIS